MRKDLTLREEMRRRDSRSPTRSKVRVKGGDVVALLLAAAAAAVVTTGCIWEMGP